MMTIEQMMLAPIMRFRAEQLQAKFPSVVYLSGRRGPTAQAKAMAINHLQDDTYLLRTYTHGAVFHNAIARMPVSAQGKVFDVAKAIEYVLTSEPNLLVWSHRDGHAVDILPMEDAMGQPNAEGQRVINWIQGCEDTVTFLTREGRLVRWHWQCREAETAKEV